MPIRTQPYAYQSEDADRMDERYGGRTLVANEMGCIHPHLMLKCHKSGRTQTAARWYSSGELPWLPAYTPGGEIAVRQPVRMIVKPFMRYVQVAGDDFDATVGSHHLFLCVSEDGPCLKYAKDLKAGDRLLMLATSSPANSDGILATSIESTPSNGRTGSACASATAVYESLKEPSSSASASKNPTATSSSSSPKTPDTPGTCSDSQDPPKTPKTQSDLTSSAPSCCNLSSGSWERAEKPNDERPICRRNSNGTSGEVCSTPTDQSARGETRSWSPSATPPNPSCSPSNGRCSETTFAVETTSGTPVPGKCPPVVPAPRCVSATGCTQTQPGVSVAKFGCSLKPGIRHLSPKGEHFIPASFRHLTPSKVRKVTEAGEGEVYDLEMPGLGNYFDAEGLNHQNTGKTLTSLLYYERYQADKRLVVVCPASLKVNWQREVMQHTGRRSEILESRKTFALHHIPKTTVTILNYDILGAWMDRLKDPRFGLHMVVMDEVHAIKSRSSQRSKAAKRLCQEVPHVLLLSGTPMTNRPAELWPALNIIQPKLYPSFFSFANRYCKPRHTPWGVKYDGSQRLEELHRRLRQTCMIRRRKADVLSHLPPKTRTPVTLPLSNRKEYEKAENNFGTWLQDTFPERASSSRANQRLVQMGYLKRLAGELKLRAVKDWIDSYTEEAGKKLIVFGLHNKVLEPLHDHYKRSSVLVTGAVTGEKRQIAFDQFLKDKKTSLFFGNIMAAGTGWSAKGVDTVAFCELDWVPGNHTQAEDRVHGVGRGVDGSVSQIFYLIAEDTIEEDLAAVLQEKQQTLDRALDGKVTAEGINLYDLIESRLKDRVQSRKRRK